MGQNSASYVKRIMIIVLLLFRFSQQQFLQATHITLPGALPDGVAFASLQAVAELYGVEESH